MIFALLNITPNIYISYTTTTLSRRLTNQLSEKSAIKYNEMTEHNKDTDKLKSPDIRQILINNTKIIYKNNYKNSFKIVKSDNYKKFKHTKNKKHSPKV